MVSLIVYCARNIKNLKLTFDGIRLQIKVKHRSFYVGSTPVNSVDICSNYVAKINCLGTVKTRLRFFSAVAAAFRIKYSINKSRRLIENRKKRGVTSHRSLSSLCLNRRGYLNNIQFINIDWPLRSVRMSDLFFYPIVRELR